MLAAVSQSPSRMKGIIGLAVAAVLVLLQLAAVAAWRAEPAIHLAPVDGPELVTERRA